jgi:hypothetical protein
MVDQQKEKHLEVKMGQTVDQQKEKHLKVQMNRMVDQLEIQNE